MNTRLAVMLVGGVLLLGASICAFRVDRAHDMAVARSEYALESGGPLETPSAPGEVGHVRGPIAGPVITWTQFDGGYIRLNIERPEMVEVHNSGPVAIGLPTMRMPDSCAEPCALKIEQQRIALHANAAEDDSREQRQQVVNELIGQRLIALEAMPEPRAPGPSLGEVLIITIGGVVPIWGTLLLLLFGLPRRLRAKMSDW